MLKIIRGLGQLETVFTLSKTLSEARPREPGASRPSSRRLLVKGKDLIDRCAWGEAEFLLRPLTRDRAGNRNAQVALLNMVGLCVR